MLKIPSKEAVFKKELAKLNEIFTDVEPAKTKLCEGLIEDAAFLLAENHVLKEVIAKTGMIKIHPSHPELQKQTEAGKQYLKNLNSYAVVIKTLNGVLSKDLSEGDDEFDKFMREANGGE